MDGIERGERRDATAGRAASLNGEGEFKGREEEGKRERGKEGKGEEGKMGRREKGKRERRGRGKRGEV